MRLYRLNAARLHVNKSALDATRVFLVHGDDVNVTRLYSTGIDETPSKFLDGIDASRVADRGAALVALMNGLTLKKSTGSLARARFFATVGIGDVCAS